MLDGKYLFHWFKETVYAVATAGLLYVAISLADTGMVDDWRTYLWAVLAGAGRAMVAVAINKIIDLKNRLGAGGGG